MKGILALFGLAHALSLQMPLGNQEERYLISTAESQSEWMTEAQIFQLYRDNVKFIDLTDGTWESLGSDVGVLTKTAFPSTLAQKSLIDATFEAIDQTRMKTFLTQFSGFHTRYYRSDSGRASAQFLFDLLTEISESLPETASFALKLTKIEHKWKQFSIVARLEAKSNVELESKQEIIVLSAHQDSINQWNPWFGRSPGADDDGSGSTTVLEALRCIVANVNFVPKRPIEFHWYSGEEGGLLGSQAVASLYSAQKIPVLAVYHSDMTGYTKPKVDPVFGIATDYVDDDLSQFLTQVVSQVTNLKVVPTKCGYACSDHASWTKTGVPAAFSFEAPFGDSSPYIHTTGDTVDTINFEHVAEFVKSVIAFGIELSLL